MALDVQTTGRCCRDADSGVGGSPVSVYGSLAPGLPATREVILGLGGCAAFRAAARGSVLLRLGSSVANPAKYVQYSSGSLGRRLRLATDGSPARDARTGPGGPIQRSLLDDAFIVRTGESAGYFNQGMSLSVTTRWGLHCSNNTNPAAPSDAWRTS